RRRPAVPGCRRARQWDRARSSSVISAFGMIERIGLLLDDARPRREVDRFLEPGALVVELIDGTREFDEGRAEVAARLAFADRILDVPKFCIHPLELRVELVEPHAIDVTETDRAQGGELVRDILELARIFEALGLYFEDGDLVHQLADRDRHQDVLWRNVSRAHAAPSAFAGACSARSAIPADGVAPSVVLRRRAIVGRYIGSCAIVRCDLRGCDDRK